MDLRDTSVSFLIYGMCAVSTLSCFYGRGRSKDADKKKKQKDKSKTKGRKVAILQKTLTVTAVAVAVAIASDTYCLTPSHIFFLI